MTHRVRPSIDDSSRRDAHTYDAQFLALAEQLGCNLWTADEDFEKAMNRNGFSQVKGIRAYPVLTR